MMDSLIRKRTNNNELFNDGTVPIEIGYIEGERVIKIIFGFMYRFINS